jgi:hypothetical protein
MSETPSPEVVAAVHHAYGKARFEQSPELGQLFEALSQCEFPVIVKDRVAKIKPKDKPEYSYTYADLATQKVGTQPELKKNKLVVIQQVGSDDKGAIIRTMLGHASGQWVAATFSLSTSGLKPQDWGSAITYGRRYARGAILDLATEDDDASTATHGEDTSEPGSPLQPPTPRAPTPQPGRRLTGVKVPASFKNNGGKDLAELESKELSSLADYFLKASLDPKKATYAASNKALHDACVLEAMSREGK